MSVDLPVGCIGHTFSMMQNKSRLARREETELIGLIAGKKRNSIEHHYRLGTIYFDRRMLKSAEASLVRTGELTNILHDMETVRYQAALSTEVMIEENSKWPYCYMKKYSEQPMVPSYSMDKIRATESRLRQIDEDLSFVRSMQKKFWKSGPVRMLPCLLARFARDSNELCDCEEWIRIVQHSPLILWN